VANQRSYVVAYVQAEGILLHMTLSITFIRFYVNVLLLVLAGCFMFVPQSMDSFITWAVYALITAMISAVCLVAVNYLCEKNEFYFILEKVRCMKK